LSTVIRSTSAFNLSDDCFIRTPLKKWELSPRQNKRIGMPLVRPMESFGP
jgi:hypothetical protein